MRWLRSVQLWCLLLAGLLSLLLSLTPALAQEPPTLDTAASEGAVLLGGNVLFTLADQAEADTLAQRASRIAERIEYLARNADIPPEAITTQTIAQGTAIGAEDVLLLTVTAADAAAAEQPAEDLAKQYASAIQAGIQIYREERSTEYLSRALGLTAAITLGLLLTLLILSNAMPQFYRWLDEQQDHWIPNVRIQNFELLSAQQLSGLIRVFTRLLHWILVVGLLIAYLSFVLELFPQTRRLGRGLLGQVKGALGVIQTRLIDYLPNLLSIGLIIVITFYALRLLRWLFINVRRGRLSLPGFYPEWAEPTYRLLQFMTLAFAVAVIFPYLPGANSPAFQGVSIFLGVLVSLGSGGVIVSVLAGFVLVYTRAFELGDRIKVADVEGFVEEKSLFVTRIRTLTNVLVSVPNATLVSSNIVNYSALLRDRQMSVILTTTITLGYDAPWRLVYETLIDAAKATNGILHDPRPIVQQKALSDFYVEYEVRAHTDQPPYMEAIYSELHQNIQDKCNAVGIEILSPHYRAVRDGNTTTIPADYWPADYEAPGFRVQPPGPEKIG
ncbi:MAG: mechanosensitive ion channel family protein [Nodosilinea sp.]